jgi:integrase
MKGYVRKRGNKWSYTVDIGRDPITGRRKQKTKSGFKTKKEAEHSLNELLYEYSKGTYIEPQKITVQEIAQEWLGHYKHQLRLTTAEQYESKMNKWILPLIGHYKLQDLKPIHAQAFVNQLLESLESSSAHKVLAITKLILKYAVQMELIPKNPFLNISVKDQKRKVNTWTFDELEHFLKVVKKNDEFYYRIFAVAAYTGLRKGEILALSRSNINFAHNKIVVKQSIAETKEKGVYIDELKTPSSYRLVAFDSFVSSILKEQIKKNNEMKLKLGSDYQDQDLLFCHPDGVIYRPTNLNRPFKKYIELSGVPKIRFHDLRHTHATLLLELSVNPKIVADRLGHSTVKITLDTYSHASLEIQSDVAQIFSKRARNM